MAVARRVGGVTLARSVRDQGFADKYRRAGHDWALSPLRPCELPSRSLGRALSRCARELGEVERRWSDGGLRQQDVNLPAVMGVMEEEFRQNEMDRHLPWRAIHAVERQSPSAAARFQDAAYDLDDP
jgi:hypothetical protein